MLPNIWLIFQQSHFQIHIWKRKFLFNIEDENINLFYERGKMSIFR